MVAGYGCFGLYWGAWGAALPAIRSHSGAGEAELGVALLMIGLGALLTMRPTGSVIDRFGGRVLPTTVAAFAVTAVLPAVVTSPVALGAVLLLMAAASGAMDVALSDAGSTEEAVSGPLLNLAHGGFSAAVLGASLATAGARALDTPPVVILGTVAVVLAAGALWLARTAPRTTAPRETPTDREHRRPARVLVVLGLLATLAYVVENAWQSWSAVHLADDLGAGPGTAGLGPAVFAAATTSGRLLGQRLAHTRTDRQVLAGGALLAAAGSLLCALAGTTGLAFAGLALAGLGTAVCAPTLLGVTGRWAGPARRGSAIATVTTLAYLGFILGPAAIGLLAAATDLPAALAAISLVAVLLAVLTPAVPRLPRAGTVPVTPLRES